MNGIEWALQELIPKPAQPDEFTVAQLMERSGMNRNTVRAILVKREESGELQSRMGNVGGSSVRLYRKV